MISLPVPRLGCKKSQMTFKNCLFLSVDEFSTSGLTGNQEWLDKVLKAPHSPHVFAFAHTWRFLRKPYRWDMDNCREARSIYQQSGRCWGKGRILWPRPPLRPFKCEVTELERRQIHPPICDWYRRSPICYRQNTSCRRRLANQPCGSCGTEVRVCRRRRGRNESDDCIQG